MKNLKLWIAAITILAGSFTTNAQNTKKVNTTESKIIWTGKKVTGKHTGTIDLKSGDLVFNNKKLVGGNFVMNMNTISATDLSGEYKTDLDNHLKADDFFGVEKFPTASLALKSIGTKSKNTYVVTADLTIKGITKPITFDIVITKNTAATKLIIDRTKYDIKFNSGNFFENLGDKTIDDNFELVVKLKY